MKANFQTIIVNIPAGKPVTKAVSGTFFIVLASQGPLIVQPDNAGPGLECVIGRGKVVDQFSALNITNPNTFACDVVILVDDGAFYSDIVEERFAPTFTTSDAFGMFDNGWVVIPGQISLNGFTYRRKRMWLTNLHATLPCYINSLNALSGTNDANKKMLALGFQFGANSTSAIENEVGERGLVIAANNGERVIDGSDSIRLFNPGASVDVMEITALIDWYLIH